MVEPVDVNPHLAIPAFPELQDTSDELERPAAGYEHGALTNLNPFDQHAHRANFLNIMNCIIMPETYQVLQMED